MTQKDILKDFYVEMIVTYLYARLDDVPTVPFLVTIRKNISDNSLTTLDIIVTSVNESKTQEVYNNVKTIVSSMAVKTPLVSFMSYEFIDEKINEFDYLNHQPEGSYMLYRHDKRVTMLSKNSHGELYGFY